MSICIDQYTFWNYTYSLMSISLAGIYDSYGRYEYRSLKNVKLFIRVLIDIVAIFLQHFQRKQIALYYH